MRRGYEYRGPHHINPTSRGGSDSPDNIYPAECWPPEKGQHISWHDIFMNLRAREAKEKIRKYMNRDGNIKEEFYHIYFIVSKPRKKLNADPVIKEKRCSRKKAEKKKKAWNIVFPNMNAREAIEWIDREFIRKEWY